MNRPGRSRRRPFGRWLLLIVVLAGITVILSRPGGPLQSLRDGLGHRSARFLERRSADSARLRFARMFMKDLALAGVDTSLTRIEWLAPGAPDSTESPEKSPAPPPRVPLGRWEIPLPAGFHAATARDLTEAAVEKLGGRLTSEDSPDTHQVFLTAQFSSGFDVEVLFMGKDSSPSNTPRIALLIDDFGNRNLAESEQILELGPGLTMAILPHTTGARDLADRCRERGMEVVLNLPMEGLDYPRIDPGPNPILVDTPPGEIQKRVLAGLDELGDARGVHTHLGQLAVEDPDVMQVVLEAVASRKAYFVDSTPTPYSQVAVKSGSLGVASIRLRQNLDGRNSTESAVRKNLEDLAERALKRGRAVGLLHPFPATVAALRDLLPRWRSAGYEIVPLSEYLEPESEPQ